MHGKQDMKVNIYYGGRGVLDDPTLYVIRKMQQALSELMVEVDVYNIYEHKNSIATLPNTLRDADGIILATTVEWLGIGGYMTQFLDACWLYGDKEAISSIYMQPVVISTTYGEREGMVTLENAWNILGGQPCSGLCGYVENAEDFSRNQEYGKIIEKKAENLYRTISQKTRGLPTSSQAVKKTILRTQSMDLTPQESEQLSRFVSNDQYVRQQKQDVIELSSMYGSLLGQSPDDPAEESYISIFTSAFRAQDSAEATYLFRIGDQQKPLLVKISGAHIEVAFRESDSADLSARLSRQTLDQITEGRMTFQRAFSIGEMNVKGSMALVRRLDEYFPFSE